LVVNFLALLHFTKIFYTFVIVARLDRYIGTPGERASAVRRLAEVLEEMAARSVSGVKITIKPASPPKTWGQLKIFHGFIVPAFCSAAEEMGENISLKTQKEILKRRFLLWPMVEKNGDLMIDRETGEAFYYIPSLSELSISQMSQFIENCIILFNEQNGREIGI
jgi:hypothetical protein